MKLTRYKRSSNNVKCADSEKTAKKYLKFTNHMPKLCNFLRFLLIFSSVDLHFTNNLRFRKKIIFFDVWVYSTGGGGYHDKSKLTEIL